MGRLPVVPEPWSPWCPSLEYEGNGKRAGADKLGKEFERLWLSGISSSLPRAA